MKLILCLMVFILFFKSYDANNSTTSTSSKTCRTLSPKILELPDDICVTRPLKSICYRGEISDVNQILYFTPRFNITEMSNKGLNAYVNLFYQHPHYQAGDRSQTCFCDYYCSGNMVAGEFRFNIDCNYGQIWSLSFFHCYVCRDMDRAYECKIRKFLV